MYYRAAAQAADASTRRSHCFAVPAGDRPIARGARAALAPMEGSRHRRGLGRPRCVERENARAPPDPISLGYVIYVHTYISDGGGSQLQLQLCCGVLDGMGWMWLRRACVSFDLVLACVAFFARGRRWFATFCRGCGTWFTIDSRSGTSPPPLACLIVLHSMRSCMYVCVCVHEGAGTGTGVRELARALDVRQLARKQMKQNAL